MSLPTAPCGWDPIPCGCDLEEESPSGGYTPQVQYAVETAQFVLWALSGRQYGCCELTARPCRRDCASGLDGGGPWGARLLDGNWINLPCRSCSGRCACTEICETRIPNAPVCDIVEVVMDGVALEEGMYRVEDGEWLVLHPDAGCFPTCQDMWVPYGEEGSWGYTYSYGTPVPTAGLRATGALACEIIKACRNDSSCCLPKRTQSFNRQGIAVVMLDPFTFFDSYKTGIYEVDLFLTAVNPLGRPSGARVMSPDSEARSRMTTWPES